MINDDIRSEYDKIKLPEEMYPMHLDLGRHARGLHTSLLNIPLYFSSYIDVVTMAKFEQNGVYLDEKIYKSLVCMKPFIILGQYKTLDVLKEYGFQTFSDIIDESYDNEKDYVKRFEMISSELNRISLLSINEVDKLYWKVEEVLIHNSNHLRKYINKINIKLLGSI